MKLFNIKKGKRKKKWVPYNTKEEYLESIEDEEIRNLLRDCDIDLCEINIREAIRHGDNREFK